MIYMLDFSQKPKSNPKTQGQKSIGNSYWKQHCILTIVMELSFKIWGWVVGYWPTTGFPFHNDASLQSTFCNLEFSSQVRISVHEITPRATPSSNTTKFRSSKPIFKIFKVSTYLQTCQCGCVATAVARKAKVWERRLMKDFHLTPVAGEDDLETLMSQPVPENEDVLARFRRVARLAVLTSTQQKWSQVVSGACRAYVTTTECLLDSPSWFLRSL